MEFLFIVGFIGLIIWVWILSGRIKALEENLHGRAAAQPVAPGSAPAPSAAPAPVAPVTPPAHNPAPAHPGVQPAPIAAPAPAPAPALQTPAAPVTTMPAAQTGESSFDPLAWFRENALIKIGAIIFFLGAVWFVSYAVTQGWLSPTIRIFLGLLLGGVVLGTGHWQARYEKTRYLTLTALGSGIIIASVFAGQFLFELFHPALAHLMLIVAVAYTVFVALRANTEWLAAIASIAGMISPLLINSPEPNATLFFAFLLTLTAAFLVVVFKTNWRTITFDLTLGVAFFQVLFFNTNQITDNVLWGFVLAFAALFYGATTVSLVRSNRPHPLDITTLGINAVMLTIWTTQLTTHADLVMFTFAFIVAATGYALFMRAADTKLISMYAGLSAMFILIATALAFSGYTLALAYIIEVTVAIALVTYLRLPRYAVVLSALLYIIPILTTLPAYPERQWNESLFDPNAIAVYLLVLSAAFISVWTFNLARQHTNSLYLALAGWFTIITYTTTFFAIPTFWNVALGSAAASDTTMTYANLSWLLLSTLLLLTCSRAHVPKKWLSLSVGTLVVPMIAALSLLTSNAWDTGVWHAVGIGFYLTTLVFIGLSVWCIYNMKRGAVSTYRPLSTILLSASWILVTLTIWQVWHAGIADSDTSLVLTYVTWALVSYLVAFTFFTLRLPTSWITASIYSLILPIVISLQSFGGGAWRDSWLHVDAAGLYVMTTILLVTGLSLRHQLESYEGIKAPLQQLVRPLLIGSALYAFALVWLLAHAAVTSADNAVMIALFVYTVAGLVCYTVGKQTDRRDFKIAGVLLLAVVIGRLALVEIWTMEVFWRIITFLGIGALFIIAALFEKPFEEKPTAVETSE